MLDAGKPTPEVHGARPSSSNVFFWSVLSLYALLFVQGKLADPDAELYESHDFSEDEDDDSVDEGKLSKWNIKFFKNIAADMLTYSNLVL